MLAWSLRFSFLVQNENSKLESRREEITHAEPKVVLTYSVYKYEVLERY